MDLTSDLLVALRRLSTCAVADAIESFEVRLRNVGFTDGSIRCCFADMPPVVGVAVTARVRTAVPPMIGSAYADRSEWWTTLESSSVPRIAVIEDVDHPAGVGAFVGGVHGSILRALGVVAVVTNGAVRDLPTLERAGLQCFAGRIVPSHAYAHVFEVGVPVRVAGLDVSPGDLIHGDQHGIVTIPPTIADQIPGAAAALDARSSRLRALAASPAFSLDRLRALLDSSEPTRSTAAHSNEVSTDE